MALNIDFFAQLANGLSKQFGDNCEVVLHDLTTEHIENSIVYVANGHVTHRKVGDGPSHIVLETLNNHNPKDIKDQLGYLTKTDDGRILKSSTLFIRGDAGKIEGILAINYDITNLLIVENALKPLITNANEKRKVPERIPQNVNELLDDLISQSMKLIGKPVALMTKDDKVKAIKFLNDSGAFLITKSQGQGNQVLKRFRRIFNHQIRR